MGRSGELARGTADEKGLKFDLREEVFDDVAVDVGEAEVAAGVGVGEFFVIEAEEVEDGGVHVVHVDFVGDGVVAEVVGLAEGEAGFDAGAGEPLAEAAGVVVAAGAVALGVGGAAEFAAPPDEGVFEEAALFEVLQQAGDGFVDGEGVVFVLGHVGVLVPSGVVGVVGVVDLDEADAGFGESAGHEALAAEVVGECFVDAVEFFGGGGFGVDVEGVGGVGLEAPGEFVGLDDGFDFLMLSGDLDALELLGVEVAEEVELAGFGGGAEGGVLEVFDGGFFGGLAGAAEGGALVAGGEEGGAVVAGAAVGEAGGDGDEAGEVFVFGAEAVVDPGTHAGADEVGGAGVEEEGGGAVGDAFGVHAFDEAEVVGHGGHMGEEVGGPEAGLAALFEFPEGFHDAHGGAFAGFGDGAGVIEGEGDAVVLDELGFVVEGVDVGDAAGHEEEDDAFGARLMMREDGRWKMGDGGGLRGEGVEGEGAEAAGGGLEEGSPGMRIADCGLRIGHGFCFPLLFWRAVLIEATVMAVSSLDSWRSDSTLDREIRPASAMSSIQPVDSSDSSSTTPILAMNSAWLLARHAAR